MQQMISNLCEQLLKTTSNKKAKVNPVCVEDYIEEDFSEKEEDYKMDYLIVPTPTEPILGKDPLISILEKDKN